MFTSMYDSLYHNLSRKTFLFAICLSPSTNHSLTYWNLANLCHYHQQHTYYHQWNLLSSLTLISSLQNLNTSQFFIWLLCGIQHQESLFLEISSCLAFHFITFSLTSLTLWVWPPFWDPPTLHIPLCITVYQGPNSLLIWSPQISKIPRIIVMWFGFGCITSLFSLTSKSLSESCCVSRSVVSDSATPWTAVHQAPLSMGFPRQEHWSGLPFPSSKWKLVLL